MRFSILSSLVLGLLFASESSAVTYTPLQPPSYPLAVRNPYLSAWMPGSFVADLPTAVPQFWFGQNLTLGIMARVEDQVYTLLGVPAAPDGALPAVVNSATYTATHTTFSLTAGNVTVDLDFLSPVSPKDYIRQSLPFSYLTLTASNAGGAIVQVYVDIDESWTGQSGATVSNFSTSAKTSIYQLSADGAEVYTQNDMDQALWGDVIFASRPSNTSTLSTQSGSAVSVRDLFASNGTLSGSNPAYAPGDVAAIAQNLGAVSGDASATFALGYVREEAINYLGNARTGYYRSTYPDSISAVSHFLDDFADATAEASATDSDLDSRARNAAGGNYSDIINLSVRQSFGAADVTIPNDSLDTNDVMVFLKEISSDGNVNTIDVIFPTFPIYYVLDPEYIRLVLEPVVQYLETGRWTLPYTIHDIGSSYPNATGHDDGQAEAQPVEECGNLLILAYAYTLASNSSAWASSHRALFQSYADYLISDGFNMSSQLSTDDGAGPLPNQTNLAIKAAVGLHAFGALFDADNYTSLALSRANDLYNNSLATDAEKSHFLLQYPESLNPNTSTYSTTFNIYPDVLLALNTFPQAALDMQASYYPTQRAEAGVPLDSRVDWGKTDEGLFAAAASPGIGSDRGTLDLYINDIHAFISNGLNTAPFSDRWFVKEGVDDDGNPAVIGTFNNYRARPVVGGHFAVIALEEARGEVVPPSVSVE